MIKRIIEAVPVSAIDPLSDLIGLIDLIETELGLSTGRRSVSNRLSEITDEIRRTAGVVTQENVSGLLEVIECLKKVERLLLDNGFETARDISHG